MYSTQRSNRNFCVGAPRSYSIHFLFPIDERACVRKKKEREVTPKVSRLDYRGEGGNTKRERERDAFLCLLGSKKKEGGWKHQKERRADVINSRRQPGRLRIAWQTRKTGSERRKGHCVVVVREKNFFLEVDGVWWGVGVGVGDTDVDALMIIGVHNCHQCLSTCVRPDQRWQSQ